MVGDMTKKNVVTRQFNILTTFSLYKLGYIYLAKVMPAVQYVNEMMHVFEMVLFIAYATL